MMVKWTVGTRLGPVGLCCFILTIFRLVTYFNSARAMVRENQPILAIPATNINSRRPCHDLGVGRFFIIWYAKYNPTPWTIYSNWKASSKEDNSQYNYNPFSFLFGWLITQCVSQRVACMSICYMCFCWARPNCCAITCHVAGAFNWLPSCNLT